MKYGIREICDVVLKAKSRMKVGNKIFYKDEPVLYFDSLKTSTLESSTTTVYAQGGRGNSRLMAWEGERTVTFTMEDALISDVSLAILTGAELIETKEVPIIQHLTEILTLNNENFNNGQIILSNIASSKSQIYVMKLDTYGEVDSEPYIYVSDGIKKNIHLKVDNYTPDKYQPKKGDTVLIDYYTELSNKAQQINITANSFGGNFYLEASTLFRNPQGVDVPAEFIIPNCKIQSNFTFNMASSGDPSTFTFTMDAFPDYTRFDKGKKVLLVIQAIETQTEKELEYYSEGLEYTLSNGTYEVTGIGDCTDKDIIIPSQYNGIAVTSIGGAAFYGCDGLTSITIPNSVTNIGSGAFYDCSGLTSIIIPNSVTNIDDSAFYGCSGLTSIRVDAENPEYCSDEYGVLFNKDKTTLLQAPARIRGRYTVPDGVTTIGSGAFYLCNSLTNITIPDSVTSIGNEAFYGCNNLTSESFGNNVTSIGDATFYGCDGLTSITIPDSVTSIGYAAFYNCSSLTLVSIGSNVTTIGRDAFYGCNNLNSITIDNYRDEISGSPWGTDLEIINWTKGDKE